MKERLSGVRIPFVANAGQTDPAVAYYAQTFAGTVFVTRDGRIVYSLPGEKAPVSRPSERTSAFIARASNRKPGWSLTETPMGGRAAPIGSERASTNVSYFIGNDRSRWKSGLETFEGVSLGEIWPGIRLELRARGKNVEKLFTVEPGGDPSRIRMRVNGARSLRVNADGALVMKTDLGEVTFTSPLAFQERQGVRHPVQVAYRVRGEEYRFRLGNHDPTLPVLIDPLLQATYLGGSADEGANALAIHPKSGDVYVAGGTASTDFPGTAGGAQAAFDGVGDAFVARLNPTLTKVIQTTYLGGSSNDGASALAIDATSGDVYVAGSTASSNFPGTTDAAQPAKSAFANAFVAHLNPSLTTLMRATYLGGSSGDVAYALAISPTSGEVYVAGLASSANFPGTVGGAQPLYGGANCPFECFAGDAFVARFNPSLTTLSQATYLGGSSDDRALALAINPTSGDVYVTGTTSSTDFPVSAGSIQAAKGRGAAENAFLARLNPSLTILTQSTYLGGNDIDYARALVIHPTSGDVYVAGSTSSTNFPGTTGGAQATSGLGLDAFVARLNSSLTTLFQATYLGGRASDLDSGYIGRDEAYALAIHPTSGEIYVAGSTGSTDFPGTTGGAQHAHGGGTSFYEPGGDAFVARLNPSLTILFQATYLGGSGNDFAGVIAIHPTSGDVYVAGSTKSMNLTGTPGGAQAIISGGRDAFVARLTADLASGLCGADATTLCLNGGRFKVQTRWTTFDGRSGTGQAVRLTADTGYFTFFTPNNVEVIVKVVSGCGFNSRVWTFAAGLTDVNVLMTVTDTKTGEVKTYVNPQGTAFAPIQDTSAFAACSTTPEAWLASAPEPAEMISAAVALAAESVAACTADATTLCLNGGRFKIQTQWMTADGKSGAGQATSMTADTGSFWFFSPNNVEVIAKVVSGCGFNSRYWTFAGGLTDVNVVMTVTDTKTGAVRTYINPQGLAFQPIQDTSAFATCP